MDLFYCRIEGGNFGDDMNAWFWEAAFPEFRLMAPDHTMFGIGSILGRDFLKDFERVVVMGSGAGYGPFPDDLPVRIRYAWVRGPMTAANLGLPPDRALTDPACLTPRLGDFRDPGTAGRRVFVPHCGTERLPIDWAGVADAAGMTLVSPAEESKSVIARIASAELVVTESLHGAVIADAFRVPWVPLAISPTFSSFKWSDWAKSMELQIEIAPALGPLKRLYRAYSELRARLRVRRRPASAPEPGRAAVRLPVGALQAKGEEYRLNRSRKNEIRDLAARYRWPLERLLIADLRRASRRRPHLSDDAVLARRQDQIVARLAETREEMSRLV